jgi:tetratricopeptide (TPR) repeat protein
MGADFRICPACGTRNKLKWEFCVKCGESLQDVQAATSGGTSDVARREPLSLSGFDWKGALGTVVALGIALGVGLKFRPQPAQADPGIFQNPVRTEVAAAKEPRIAVGELRNASLDEGLRRLNSGDARSALDILAQAVAEHPSDGQARFAYGQALYQAGQAPAAVAQLTEAARLDPRNARASADAAKILVSLGRAADAIPLYEAAIRADASSPAWMSQLGQLYLDQGNTKRAAELLEQAVTASGGNARFLQQLGYAQEKAGNSTAAMDAYRRALEHDPSSGTTRALLAERVMAAGRTDDAIALLRDGVARDPKLNRALGSLFERSGRASEAATAYREYARGNPGAADAAAMEERAKALEGS